MTAALLVLALMGQVDFPTFFVAAPRDAESRPESGHGPYSDTVPPTLTLKTYSTHTLIGAADPDSGVNWDSLSVIHSGHDIASQFIRIGDVLTGPPVNGVVTVSIRDKQAATGAEVGNLTRIERHVTPIDPPVEPPNPNPNQPRIDEIQVRMAEINDVERSAAR